MTPNQLLHEFIMWTDMMIRIEWWGWWIVLFLFLFSVALIAAFSVSGKD